MTDRPLCTCHGRPMWRGGKSGWTCATRESARNSRRIRMGAGGLEFFVGRTPTPEAALTLRTRISEEAPRVTVRNP